jgi:hypothetical protein
MVFEDLSPASQSAVTAFGENECRLWWSDYMMGIRTPHRLSESRQVSAGREIYVQEGGTVPEGAQGAIR